MTLIKVLLYDYLNIVTLNKASKLVAIEGCLLPNYLNYHEQLAWVSDNYSYQ